MLEKFRKNKDEEETTVAPFVNIYEKDKEIIIAVEMPGVDKNSLDLNLDGNQLIIQGKKQKEEIGKEYTLLHRERRPVSFERRFEINTQIDREKIKAEYTDGVLKVSLSKSEEAQPQKIVIKT
ncbi:MAG: Hsp20/alpha crystallin family protein [Candidatus Omnitrophica bacterium]|nr:Hsp20/alpha crystallin family protein [Candidatus Omnitrophota bacterium]